MSWFPSRHIGAKIIPFTSKSYFSHVNTASPNSGRVTGHFEIL